MFFLPVLKKKKTSASADLSLGKTAAPPPLLIANMKGDLHTSQKVFCAPPSSVATRK